MSTIDQSAFQMNGGVISTTNINVTTSVEEFTLPPIGSEGNTVVLTVRGDQPVFIDYKKANASVDTSMILLPNKSYTISMPGGRTTLAVIAEIDGSRLYATTGRGVLY
jgi:hypothetical protein